MLIEFSVANFRSFNERQTFSLAKAKGNEHVGTNTFKIEAAGEFELLRSAVVYGPNAGGKSNFLLALRTMQRIVLESATTRQHGDKLLVTPFRLSRQTLDKASEFEVTFIVDQVRYQYGFSATPDRIHDEWLLAYPKGRAQQWFQRTWDKQTKKYIWEMGSHLSGEKQVWQKSTRDNALFLSTAVSLNSQQLQPIFDWFKNTVRMTGIAGWDPGFSASLCEGDGENPVLAFLRQADLDIADVIVEKKPFDAEYLREDMPAPVRNALLEEMKDKEFLNIRLVHTSNEGELVEFDFEEESDGTQKLFSFAGPWVDTLANGYVLFIDELHDNLHPSLVRFLVQLFHSDKTNPKNAQLVFTTHETSILSQDVFRRDQIWFCERNEQQASLLYPLTDFSPRKGRENLEQAYLSGRYGALPYLKILDKTG